MLSRFVLAAIVALISATLAPSGTSAHTGAALPFVQATPVPSGWTARPAQYPNSVVVTDLPIPMSDGVVLRGDLQLPADADGHRIPGTFPVIVTITAYNKTIIASPSMPLGGEGPGYLVSRGYAHLTVDARGTGSSDGHWEAFSARENADAGEIIEWAHRQSDWSDGNIGMTGPSYMGISQIFAAGAQPAGLKAIFPQVPGADVYRDIVATGGQIDVGFMPLWLGLVTFTGLIPPAYTQEDPEAGLAWLLDRLRGATEFTLPMMGEAILGQEPAYDGPFYAERSPINVVDSVEVPTFFVGGHYDLFQRGTPLLFESLRTRGVPTKFILGPWDHLQGSSGADVGDAGYGTLAELQLRWFDHYVRGVADPALDTDIAAFTYYEINSGIWQQADDWIGPHHVAASFRLSGTATLGGGAGGLSRGATEPGTSTLMPLPVTGLCTRSANQWTAGVPALIMADLPCFHDNQWNDLLGLVFDTEPMAEPFRLQGPMNAHLHVSSLSGDGLLAVAVSSVAPDGSVNRLTGGWQMISHRALDTSRTRYLDGKIIQPYHPHTQAAKAALGPLQIAPVDVEILSTGAVIPAGHRLRLSVQAFDVPHLLPVLGDLLGTLTPISIHNSPAHPSELTVPQVGQLRTPPSTAAAVPTATHAALRKARTTPGQRNRVRVRVRTADGHPASGRVRIKVGKQVRRATLDDRGRAVVRLPKRQRVGKHRVVVRFLGHSTQAPSRTKVVWRVRH
ncbi:CocE/NonD family hydrolase [Nocardioides limicola]|uniref:CocE/NonD family hydrolase n=1 Tax=Nocardioides limicola TaxID=2803368 RepID=UPI00193BBF8A|nr:CocE/NonD family hydrolase [Nocardioides sp. DJM-14]